MLVIEHVDVSSRSQVNRFVRIPYRLYAKHPYWVPPVLADARAMLNPRKHPFYEHSEADFFIAVQDGRDVGRIATLENRRFNEHHKTHESQFCLFECEDDMETAEAIFNRAFEWAKARRLDHIVGPKGFASFDPYGMLIDGFEHRQVMTMLNYNFEYYPQMVAAQGFEKEVDFISCYLDPTLFKLPERIRRIAERVRKRGTLKVKRFSSKRELRQWGAQIGEAYNKTFVNNWEYYPLSDNEIKFLVNQVMTIADHRLIKVITHNDDVVGFLFGFPDVSAALQRARGHLLPFGLADLLLELRKTEWIALNGAGILPEYQGIGGNALLYSEIQKSLEEFNFKHANMTQVAESAVQMRRDLINLGGTPYTNHRVYSRSI